MGIRRAWLLCSIVGMLGGCGSAASYDYDLPPVVDPPPRMTMLGAIDYEGMASAQRELVRVALVWLPVEPARGKNQIGQTAKMRPGHLNFEIDVSQEPPPQAIEGADAMRYGQAEVVLYEDRNRNETFDIVEGNGSQDRVIGRANGVRLWWLGAGSPAPSAFRGYKPVTPGWSLTYGPISAEPKANSTGWSDDCAPDRENGGALHRRCPLRIEKPAVDLSPADPFVITVSSDPRLQAYACAGYWGTSSEKTDEWPDDTPGWNAPELRKQICPTCDCKVNCPLDLPAPERKLTTKLMCDASKRAYYWKDCVSDPKLCGTVFCHYGHGELKEGEPVPPGWPTCED